jgi:predicted nucleotidyltransferase
MTLVGRVAAHLDAARVRFAVIGAAAMAVHGISRSTFDIDLLAMDDRVLDRAFWTAFAAGVQVDVRRGDDDDPLAGAVRLTAAAARDVDIVVGRSAWQEDLLARAVRADIDGTNLPVVNLDGLVLLKLYAGGSQDVWDLEQLLVTGDRDRLLTAVDAVIDGLPAASRELWERLKSSSS